MCVAILITMVYNVSSYTELLLAYYKCHQANYKMYSKFPTLNATSYMTICNVKEHLSEQL